LKKLLKIGCVSLKMPNDWFDILGNSHRRNILKYISKKPLYQNEIAIKLGITPSAVNKHLELLQERGIIIIKELERIEGRGRRKLKYCYFNPKFSFPQNFNYPFSIKFDRSGSKSVEEDEYIDVEIEDVTKTKVDLERIQLNDSNTSEFTHVIQKLQFSQSNVVKYRNKFIEIINQYEIVQVYSYLLETYSTTQLFTRQDIMSHYKCNFDTAKLITDILERDVGLAEFIEMDQTERVAKWRLIDFTLS